MGSPEAELEFVIVTDVSVRGSGNGRNDLRRVLDRHVLCELPTVSGILTSLLSSEAIVDVQRWIGSVVLGLRRLFIVSGRHCRCSGGVGR